MLPIDVSLHIPATTSDPRQNIDNTTSIPNNTHSSTLTSRVYLLVDTGSSSLALSIESDTSIQTNEKSNPLDIHGSLDCPQTIVVHNIHEICAHPYSMQFGSANVSQALLCSADVSIPSSITADTVSLTQRNSLNNVLGAQSFQFVGIQHQSGLLQCSTFSSPITSWGHDIDTYFHYNIPIDDYSPPSRHLRSSSSSPQIEHHNATLSHAHQNYSSSLYPFATSIPSILQGTDIPFSNRLRQQSGLIGLSYPTLLHSIPSDASISPHSFLSKLIPTHPQSNIASNVTTSSVIDNNLTTVPTGNTTQYNQTTNNYNHNQSNREEISSISSFSLRFNDQPDDILATLQHIISLHNSSSTPVDVDPRDTTFIQNQLSTLTTANLTFQGMSSKSQIETLRFAPIFDASFHRLPLADIVLQFSRGVLNRFLSRRQMQEGIDYTHNEAVTDQNQFEMISNDDDDDDDSDHIELSLFGLYHKLQSHGSFLRLFQQMDQGGDTPVNTSIADIDQIQCQISPNSSSFSPTACHVMHTFANTSLSSETHQQIMHNHTLRALNSIATNAAPFQQSPFVASMRPNSKLGSIPSLHPTKIISHQALPLNNSHSPSSPSSSVSSPPTPDYWFTRFENALHSLLQSPQLNARFQTIVNQSSSSSPPIGNTNSTQLTVAAATPHDTSRSIDGSIESELTHVHTKSFSSSPSPSSSSPSPSSSSSPLFSTYTTSFLESILPIDDDEPTTSPTPRRRQSNNAGLSTGVLNTGAFPISTVLVDTGTSPIGLHPHLFALFVITVEAILGITFPSSFWLSHHPFPIERATTSFLDAYMRPVATQSAEQNEPVSSSVASETHNNYAQSRVVTNNVSLSDDVFPFLHNEQSALDGNQALRDYDDILHTSKLSPQFDYFPTAQPGTHRNHAAHIVNPLCSQFSRNCSPSNSTNQSFKNNSTSHGHQHIPSPALPSPSTSIIDDFPIIRFRLLRSIQDSTQQSCHLIVSQTLAKILLSPAKTVHNPDIVHSSLLDDLLNHIQSNSSFNGGSLSNGPIQAMFSKIIETHTHRCMALRNDAYDTAEYAYQQLYDDVFQQILTGGHASSSLSSPSSEEAHREGFHESSKHSYSSTYPPHLNPYSCQSDQSCFNATRRDTMQQQLLSNSLFHQPVADHLQQLFLPQLIETITTQTQQQQQANSSLHPHDPMSPGFLEQQRRIQPLPARNATQQHPVIPFNAQSSSKRTTATHDLGAFLEDEAALSPDTFPPLQETIIQTSASVQSPFDRSPNTILTQNDIPISVPNALENHTSAIFKTPRLPFLDIDIHPHRYLPYTSSFQRNPPSQNQGHSNDLFPSNETITPLQYIDAYTNVFGGNVFMIIPYESNILGLSLLANYDVFFDMENFRVGFGLKTEHYNYSIYHNRYDQPINTTDVFHPAIAKNASTKQQQQQKHYHTLLSNSSDNFLTSAFTDLSSLQSSLFSNHVFPTVALKQFQNSIVPMLTADLTTNYYAFIFNMSSPLNSSRTTEFDILPNFAESTSTAANIDSNHTTSQYTAENNHDYLQSYLASTAAKKPPTSSTEHIAQTLDAIDDIVAGDQDHTFEKVIHTSSWKSRLWLLGFAIAKFLFYNLLFLIGIGICAFLLREFRIRERLGEYYAELQGYQFLPRQPPNTDRHHNHQSTSLLRSSHLPYQQLSASLTHEDDDNQSVHSDESSPLLRHDRRELD